MAKPLNHKETGCSPISSNCVIWQGPDIECINICTGDTVSDIIEKLSDVVCEHDTTLSMTPYDISCFNLAAGAGAPEDFPELIQFMIDRICNLEECTGCAPDCDGNSEMDIPEELATPCCDVEVEIAPCFYWTNEVGDTETTLSLSDYITAIGNKVCELENDSQTKSTQIDNVTKRTTAIENTPDPTFDEPEINVAGCLGFTEATAVSDVVVAIADMLCDYNTALGDPNDLLNGSAVPNEVAMGKQLANPGNDMKSLTGWEDPGDDVSKAMKDMWLTIVDLRAATQMALDCCPDDCEDVIINLSAQYVYPELRIWFTGSIPPDYAACHAGGMYLTITDTDGGSYSFWIDFIAVMTSGTYYALNLTTVPGINPNLNFTLTGTACVKHNDTGSVCERCLTYYLVNEADCPAIAFVQTQTTIQYNLTSTIGTHTYTVQLLSADGSIMYASQTFTTTSIVTTPGTFVGLTPGTTYRVRVSVTTGDITKVCPDSVVTTSALPCDAPVVTGSSVYTT